MIKKYKPQSGHRNKPALNKNRNRPSTYKRNRPTSTTASTRRAGSLSASARNKLRVIVLGGLEEVGRNMTLIEYNKEIIILSITI